MNTELLLRYIEGDATDQEKVTITGWLDSNPEHMKEYLALRKLHDIAIWQSSPGNQTEEKFRNRIAGRISKPIYMEVLKIAAVVLVAILVSRFLFLDFKPQYPVAMQTIHVPAGQRAEIVLVDGTKVWLNANTTFTFPNYFTAGSREVSLDGEGYFDVSDNKSNPFVIKTERYNIKVWGTKFNLMAYSETNFFETSLFEGSLEVMKSMNKQGVFIRPNECIYQEDNRLHIAPISDLNHFLWKDGIISFNDESFSELIKKLELYFDLKIEVKNDKILKYRCTGKFRTKDGVEHILKVLQLSNKFSFKIDEKTNMITIN